MTLVIACNKGDDRRHDDYYINHYNQFTTAAEGSSIVDIVNRTNIFSAKAAAGNDTIAKALALLESGDIQLYFYGNTNEAIKFYRRAIAYFESLSPACNYLFIQCCLSYMVALEHKKEFAEERKMTAKCSKLIDSLNDSAKKSTARFTIRMLEAGMYVAENKWDSLEKCISSLEEDYSKVSKADKSRYNMYLLGHKIQLAIGRKDYETALKYSNEQRKIIDSGESISRKTAHDIEHARILRGLGRGNEAYDLYSSAMDNKQAAINEVNINNLNELQKELTISIMKREMETRNFQVRFVIALIAIIAVAILFYFVVLKKLNRKNMVLIRQAKETELAERTSAQTFLQIPSERLDNDQLLYSKLLDIMEGQQMPYTNPDCNRDILAQLCATNGKYIDRIISRFADGKTTSEFITHYRLRRAMTLLTDTEETVDAIAELCGFSSTRTLYRRFHGEMGMSPTEYRNLQTESENSSV